MTTTLTTEQPPTASPIEPLVGPDVPVLFRVDFYDPCSMSQWGVARPTTQPENGRSIVMLDSNGLGWWYVNKTLEESVKTLFHAGTVSEVVIASVVLL